MSEITHVAEIRFRDLTDTQAALIETFVRRALAQDGFNAEVHFGPVGTVPNYRPAAAEDTPSLKQRNYFRRLVDELNLALKLLDASVPVEREKFIYTLAFTELNDPGLTKRRISELIDTVKETIDDVNFIRTGPRAPA
jgi:hypothetical protein